MIDIPGTEQLYTAAQTRALDHSAIHDHQVPGIILMSRAARSAFSALLEHWPGPERVQVLCGTGNNGGDGFLIADLAHRRGIAATVLQVGDLIRLGTPGYELRLIATENDSGS